jgi:Protein of unknown function (DUF3303)
MARLLPSGLRHVDSWIDVHELDRCFQLMGTDDPAQFDAWIAEWSDLDEFESIPVISPADGASRVLD